MIELLRAASAARRASLALAVALALVAASASSASAEPAPAVEAWAGRYRYAGGEPEVRGLDAAIEAVVRRMSFFIRGIARRRLREPNLPSEELEIRVGGGVVTILRPGRPTVSAPASGAVAEWRSPSGDSFRVSHRVVGGELIQRFEGSASWSENRFALQEGGARLVVDTTIEAKRLPAPLRFRTTYHRI